jgi:hypothetical protein
MNVVDTVASSSHTSVIGKFSFFLQHLPRHLLTMLVRDRQRQRSNTFSAGDDETVSIL